MKRNIMIYYIIIFCAVVFLSIFILMDGCAPDKPNLVTVGLIPANEYDPAEWGKVYPLEYESWLKTKEPRPTGKSIYKKGLDTDMILYDKLSEYPFMALLFKGWGFGVEYNEPQGHYYMRIDQDKIDPSRVGAGGVCLNCKSPYMDKLVKKHGIEFYSMPWKEAVKKIPEKHKDLGVTCVDCHDNKTMDLRVNRVVFIQGFAKLNKKEITRQEKRILVCAQCHVTYNVSKDSNMKSVGLSHPWDESTWGNISIENIIKQIKQNYSFKEWTQKVTGFKVGFIRHPEFEFFTYQSVHFNAGLACADCHMPYKKVGSFKISDHNIMSPLKDDLKACIKCHPQSEDLLKKQVIEIQKRTLSLLLRAGYGTATTAKLFELVHTYKERGKAIDNSIYDEAQNLYFEAFYRVVFMGAENSIGFHNPAEAGRILGDAIAYAAKAEGLLRQGLAQAGIPVPKDINLTLAQYLNNRGEKRLNFKQNQEFTDPFDTQNKIIPKGARGL